MLRSDIINLAKECMEESIYGAFEINEETVVETLKNSDLLLVEQDDRVVGLLVPCAVVHPYFVDCIVAKELVWQVAKDIENRKEVWMQLLGMYEDWAKRQGCHLVSLGSYRPTLTTVYEERGYTKNCDTLFKGIV